MTLRQCIGQLDSLLHNTYTDHQKILWLSALDGQIQAQLLDTHEGDTVPFVPYGPEDMDRPLLVGPPFEELYLHYLLSRIHYHDGEIDRYNNAVALFDHLYKNYVNNYNRTRRPKGATFRYF